MIISLKRAKKLNISNEKIKKLTKSTIIFTIAPAVAVGIGLFTLIPLLGIPLPWLRLSVVGALTYELPAAEAAAKVGGKVIGVDVSISFDGEEVWYSVSNQELWLRDIMDIILQE